MDKGVSDKLVNINQALISTFVLATNYYKNYVVYSSKVIITALLGEIMAPSLNPYPEFKSQLEMMHDRLIQEERRQVDD